mmetsp:Transcript_20021/g.27719  ORF Transcript_20021/g.27719 Transcript_20021/m.27719 type:complete len:292 (+) Transcript_20021:119-994(+)|eukprot:CAMPEP_0196576720 /NCGR_PEP_ID=MMETSP1081-20130531/5916_1 /TAXON_ID=36882 /ORGANISM="Pyramimonas amylifera, Strain CCMP720" /LENGTH=291 /DNA_ID=CAMNT_0041895403 /DNA_START=76 /DNA_END=951 /DNA_ORIENTATION=+
MTAYRPPGRPSQADIDAATMRIENPQRIVGSGYIQFAPQRPFAGPVIQQPPTIVSMDEYGLDPNPKTYHPTTNNQPPRSAPPPQQYHHQHAPHQQHYPQGGMPQPHQGQPAYNRPAAAQTSYRPQGVPGQQAPYGSGQTQSYYSQGGAPRQQGYNQQPQARPVSVARPAPAQAQPPPSQNSYHHPQAPRANGMINQGGVDRSHLPGGGGYAMPPRPQVNAPAKASFVAPPYVNQRPGIPVPPQQQQHFQAMRPTPNPMYAPVVNTNQAPDDDKKSKSQLKRERKKLREQDK